jgi:Predicted enzyme with a TIM-barrel fold
MRPTTPRRSTVCRCTWSGSCRATRSARCCPTSIPSNRWTRSSSPRRSRAVRPRVSRRWVCCSKSTSRASRRSPAVRPTRRLNSRCASRNSRGLSCRDWWRWARMWTTSVRSAVDSRICAMCATVCEIPTPREPPRAWSCRWAWAATWRMQSTKARRSCASGRRSSVSATSS